MARSKRIKERKKEKEVWKEVKRTRNAGTLPNCGTGRGEKLLNSFFLTKIYSLDRAKRMTKLPKSMGPLCLS